MDDLLRPEDVFALVASAISDKRAAVQPPMRLAFALVDGSRWLVDSADPGVVSRRWSRDADVTIYTDRRTLSQLALGQLDLSQPDADNLFLWGGDGLALERFANVLGGSSSLLGIRQQQGRR